MLDRSIRQCCIDDVSVSVVSIRGNLSMRIDDLDKIIAPWVEKKTVDEIITILEKAVVPCARVNSVEQAFHERQLWDREILLDMEHPGIGRMSTLGVVLKCSETPGKVSRGAPLVGQDNEEIYKGLLGYKSEDLLTLKKEAII